MFGYGNKRLNQPTITPGQGEGLWLWLLALVTGDNLQVTHDR